MKPFFLAGLLVGCATAVITARAVAPLTESTFTEIIREANVLASGQAEVPARSNLLFRAPDRVRTGMASRVELTASDHTITRVGANTIFAFAAAGREILLDKGSLLFHSPAGAGGGTVRYRGTAAAVLGTTMVCVVLPDGSFKILNLEGLVLVTLRNGQSVELKAGQMVIVPPAGDGFRELEYFNLGKLVARLLLVVGFADPLASQPLIEAAIQEQNRQLADGRIQFLVSLDLADFGLEMLTPMPEMPDHTIIYISPTRGASSPSR